MLFHLTTTLSPHTHTNAQTVCTQAHTGATHMPEHPGTQMYTHTDLGYGCNKMDDPLASPAKTNPKPHTHTHTHTHKHTSTATQTEQHMYILTL